MCRISTQTENLIDKKDQYKSIKKSLMLLLLIFESNFVKTLM